MFLQRMRAIRLLRSVRVSVSMRFPNYNGFQACLVLLCFAYSKAGFSCKENTLIWRPCARRSCSLFHRCPRKSPSLRRLSLSVAVWGGARVMAGLGGGELRGAT